MQDEKKTEASGGRPVRKPYQAPQVIPLGELARGLGANCREGATANGNCGVGGAAHATCGGGSAP